MADLEAEMTQSERKNLATPRGFEGAEVVRDRFKSNGLAPPPPPLSACREELRAAIARLASAQREVEVALAPLRRLDEVEETARRMQEELHTLMVRDEQRLGEWIAGGRAGRTPDDADTVALNSKSLAHQDELAAARRVRPEHAARHQAAVARLQAAASERDSAVSLVALEIGRSLGQEMVVALNAALAIEAKLRSLSDACRVSGVPTTASNQLDEIVNGSRQSAGVPQDASFGRGVLEGLAVDPAHGLER
jgi:hypothetical protein